MGQSEQSEVEPWRSGVVHRYRSLSVPIIGDLSCAQRDATALDGLFADTLGGNSRLLTDADAIRSAVEFELAALANCGAEDTVGIGFSRHGSEMSRAMENCPLGAMRDCPLLG